MVFDCVCGPGKVAQSSLDAVARVGSGSAAEAGLGFVQAQVTRW